MAWHAGHDDDAVAQVDGLLDVVGDEDHGALVLLPDRQGLLLHGVAGLRIECAERLVHQQHIRAVRPGAGEAHALLHAARELVRIGRLETLQADEVDVLLGGRIALGLVHAFYVKAERNVVHDRLPGEQGILLEDDSPVRAGPRHLLAVHQDFALVRHDDSGHAVEQRRLAALARPQHHHELVFLNLQRDVVQHVDGVLLGEEHLGDVAALDFYVRSLRHGQTSLSNHLRVTASDAPIMPMMIMPTMIMGGLYMSMPWMIR